MVWVLSLHSLLDEVGVVAAPLELRALLGLDRQDVGLLGAHALPGGLEVAAELGHAGGLERGRVVRALPRAVLGEVP